MSEKRHGDFDTDCEKVDKLLTCIEEAVGRLKKLGLDDENALRAASRLFNVEDAIFPGRGHH